MRLHRLSLITFTLVISGLLHAQELDRGMEVAYEVDKRDSGFVDSITNITMTLKDKAGKENVRQLRIKTLESEQGDKSVAIFDSPKDQRGVALLTHSYKIEDDDQWIYLPAIKRVKRIVAQNRSGPFVGSEFAYEDINPANVERFTYQYIGEEACGDTTCFKYERFPIDRFSGYTKQIVWVDREHYRNVKIHYYDRKESHLKTLNFYDYKLYLEKLWRPDYTIMTNHQTGNSTRLDFNSRLFGSALVENEFVSSRLPKIR
ncbi:MAG: hypothetical protein ACI9SP_000240 [Arenicella sp.]|jgi:hypothetical protein